MYDRNCSSALKVALLTLNWVSGAANAADPAVDAQTLFDEGARHLAAACVAIQQSESLHMGSVSPAYLAVCPEKGRSTQDTPDPVAAMAKADDGRRQLEAACRKFEESYTLKPAAHILLRIAACDISRGKTASAWDKCQRAKQLAVSAADEEQAQQAVECVDWLEPKLSYLTISISEPVSGIEIKRNGEVVAPDLLGRRIAVDPGKYEVSAASPGHVSLKRTVEIAAERDAQEIEIPRLAVLDISPAKPSQQPQLSDKRLVTQNSASPPTAIPWHWVVGGVGAAAFVTGTVFGLVALNSNVRLAANCPNQECAAADLTSQERRDRSATAANVGIGVGLAGMGTALALVLIRRAPSSPATKNSNTVIGGASTSFGTTLWVQGKF